MTKSRSRQVAEIDSLDHDDLVYFATDIPTLSRYDEDLGECVATATDDQIRAALITIFDTQTIPAGSDGLAGPSAMWLLGEIDL